MRLSFLYLILLICQCEVLGQNDSSSRSYLLEQLRAGDALLENLLGNACDAVQSGGSVRVSVMHEPPDQVLVRVEDDGSGIREDDLNRVYDPFFTTKPAGQGVGLGLTYVHKLVSDLGGKVTLSSTIDVGTVAACRFPQFKADATLPG